MWQWLQILAVATAALFAAGSAKACAAVAVTNQTDILTASYGRAVALAYGRHLVGGNAILLDNSDPNIATAFIALGEGAWDAPEQLFVNAAEIDLAIDANFHFHRGLAGQLSSGGNLDPEGTGSPYPFSTDGDQKADLWTPDGVQGLTFSKTAYLALRVPFDVYAPSPELNVVGTYRCRKVRTFTSGGVQDGYLWRDNPAWHIADLLTVVRGLDDSRINWASFKTAADYCDALIDPNGEGDVKRFVSNVAFTEEVDFDTALEALLITCRGYLTQDAGQISLRIDQARSSIFDFSDHPAAGAGGNIIDGSFEAWRKETRANPNRLELLFRDSANGFQVMTKAWNHLVQQARIGRVMTARAQLGNMPQQQAERIGNYLLLRDINNNLFCRLRATPASLKVMPGDVVRVKHDAAPWGQGLGGDDLWQSFEVLEATDNPDETRDFLLRVYNASTYPDTAGPAQALVDTTILRRPLPPPAPVLPTKFILSANLDGDLRLSFDIPALADYRTGDLTLLADLEKERVATALAAAMDGDDTTITVDSSAGFRVGRYISIQTEILKITGPGSVGEEPSSTTWNVDRAQKLTSAGTAAIADLVIMLTEVPEHFVFPPGWTLAHPTLDLANGEYYVLRMRPGRMRMLYASLQFSGLGGNSTLLEKSFDSFSFEPIVAGTLPGLRVADGVYALIEVPGDLALADQAAAPLVLPASAVTIGLISATVSDDAGEPGGIPVGAAVKGQLYIDDGGPLGPEFVIPDGGAGVVATSHVEFGGGGYAVNETYILLGGDMNAIIRVDSITGFGVLDTYTLLAGGSGYSEATEYALLAGGDNPGNGVGGSITVDTVTTGGSPGTGVFFSGAQLGAVAGRIIVLAITQVGSTSPGRNLRVWISF